METIGKYEFNRKDLIGHGAFAIVFKGRHKDKRDLEVAVKCINKKSLSKSQALLGKEIKILKELKHENIVGLLDYKEMGGCVYLVMEYCNGGDLAEYLHSKGTLSEDTIRGFLQQMGLAMKVLQSKGILHRDLKPQNILLCHPQGRRSSPNNICIKLADFGFARHLQTNTMAVTLCGSPMYMAPEVIMSQNYDAKADLWSIGTIVYQCLTGKAPFHASTPQELRLFYESNQNLLPSIPRETSSHLRHLLLGLLQRNHTERMNFDDFFHHPFLESSSSTKKSSPAPMHTYPSCGSGSSSGSSTTSHLASPQHSDGEMHRLQHKAQDSPTQDATGFLEKVADIQDSSNAALYTDDYVMVPAQFPSDYACEMGDGSPLEDSLIYDGCGSLGAERALSQAGRTPPSSPLTCSPSRHASGSNYSQSVPIPVPTQIQNFQRMKQNLQVAGLHDSIRATLCAGAGSTRSGSSPSYILGTASGLPSPRLSAGGAQPQPSSPLVGQSPRISEPTKPLCTRTGLIDGSGIQRSPSSRQKLQIRNPQSISPGSSCPKDQLSCYGQIRTAPGFQLHGLSPDSQANLTSNEDNRNGPFKRRLSTGRLSDMLLKAAFGAQLFLEENEENLISEKGMDPAAPPSGSHRAPGASSSPNTVGSLSRDNTPPNTTAARVPGSPSHNMNTAGLVSSHLRAGIRRASQSECMDASPHVGVVFHPPELPVDTLMEQPHTDALSELCFTLAFVNCVMEIASSKDPALEASVNPDVSFLQQSLVADQISLLSREWSYSEQLVLYMKAEEFLSSALHTAKENIKQGKLLPSATAKQVIRKLNELYKNCVTYCRSLNGRLQSFLLDKQRLMDRFSSITAEKLIYCHTVHMVQSAALDEMFHDGTESIQRYRKALLLMEGLSRIVTEQQDQDGIDKCKECIDRRLAALHSAKCL